MQVRVTGIVEDTWRQREKESLKQRVRQRIETDAKQFERQAVNLFVASVVVVLAVEKHANIGALSIIVKICRKATGNSPPP